MWDILKTKKHNLSFRSCLLWFDGVLERQFQRDSVILFLFQRQSHSPSSLHRYLKSVYSIVFHEDQLHPKLRLYHFSIGMTNSESKGRCRYVALVIVTYATMTMFGIIENLKGVTFPLIKDVFNASYDFQGYLVSISWYGYVIFCLVSTIVINRFGVKSSIVLGYGFTLVGCVITAFVPSFVTVILSLMVVWMGFGFWEVGNNALAQQVFTKNSAVYLNLMHFFYGLGAIIGPQIASLLVRLTQDSYKGVYKLITIPVVVFFLLALITPFSSSTNTNSNDSSENSKKLSVCNVLRMPFVWLCAVTLGFMEVIEFGASNWGALYYRDVYGLSVEKEGATFVSLFYVLFTVSRLFSGFIIEKLGYYTSLFGSLIIVIIIYVVGFAVGKNGIWVIPFTGYFIGIMFPTYMCLMMRIFPENTSLISSVVIFISGATNGLVQLLIGYVNEFIGNEWGFRCNVIYTLIPCLLLFWVHHRDKKKELKPVPITDVEKQDKDSEDSTIAHDTVVVETASSSTL